jgi:hypothetical protein
MLVVFAALLATSPDFGMAWDEGFTVERERVLGLWFERLIAPPPGWHRFQALDQRELNWGWPFSREEPDGHPPFYALLGLAGRLVSSPFVGQLTSYRAGPIALCAATAGVLYYFLAMRAGRLAGLVAALLLVIMPRSFAHAHYAHYDTPMTCLWILAQMAFVASLASRRWSVPFGVALGLAAGTKFTGFFAAVPPVLWTAWAEGPPAARLVLRGRSSESVPGGFPGLRTLAIGVPVAVLTLYAIQPAWWVEPVRGPMRYVISNITRDLTKPVPTMYLGRIYDFSLPWHNTVILTIAAVPVAVLLLAMLGLVATCWRAADPSLLIWPLSWATLMVVRALPNAPGHDGIRLFLPSIASLGVLAGLGAGWLKDRLQKYRVGWIAILLIAAAFVESLVGIVETYPYTDSYFSATVGGLPGAERLGLELTYYWETMGPEFFRWAHDQAQRGPLELRYSSPVITTMFLREWGTIPRKARIHPLDEVAEPFYLLQRRRGVYQPVDWWLEEHGKPLFTVSRQGVPLMRIYPFEEFVRAEVASRGIPRTHLHHGRGSHVPPPHH